MRAGVSDRGTGENRRRARNVPASGARSGRRGDAARLFSSRGRGGKERCGISQGVCPPPRVGGDARARRASRHSPVRVGSAAASHGSLSWNTSLHAGPSASRYPAVGPCVLASRGAATWCIFHGNTQFSSCGAARGLLIARANESRPQEFDWSDGTVCDWRKFLHGRNRAKQTVIRGVDFNIGCRDKVLVAVGSRHAPISDNLHLSRSRLSSFLTSGPSERGPRRTAHCRGAPFLLSPHARIHTYHAGRPRVIRAEHRAIERAATREVVPAEQPKSRRCSTIRQGCLLRAGAARGRLHDDVRRGE